MEMTGIGKSPYVTFLFKQDFTFEYFQFFQRQL